MVPQFSVTDLHFRFPIANCQFGSVLGSLDSRSSDPRAKSAIGNRKSAILKIRCSREQLSQNKGENSAMLVVVNLDWSIYSQGDKHLLQRAAAPVNQKRQIL